jgi:predicted acetylornithine/succinylornithine family transaminase
MVFHKCCIVRKELDVSPASENEHWRQRSRATAVPCYGDERIAMVRGAGCRVWDADSNEYLDLLAGIAVNCLGHAHPVVRDALAAQAAQLVHCSNKFIVPAQVELAEWLCARSFAQRVFFTNSGTEAMEAALKLARRVAHDRGEHERVEIISFAGSFHGRTYGAVSATAQAKYHNGFEPLLPGMVHLPFEDSNALEAALCHRTAAVVLEPIQGEGGVRPFSVEFMQFVRQRCTQRGALLICDEIQCGMGRTGRLFGYEHSGITPDVVTIAKALGGGVPIGALLTTAAVGDHLTNGVHGSTFGGSPLMCATALAVCRYIEQEGLIARAAEMGDYFRARLEALCATYPRATEVRGRGLMLGLGLTNGAGDLYKHLLKNGIIVNAVGQFTIRIVPPFIITREDIDFAVNHIEAWLRSEG